MSTCASNAPNSPEVMTSPRPSIISSSAGLPSLYSLTTGVYVYRTMLLNVLYAASLWAGSLGCSADPTRVRLTAHHAMSL